LRRLRAQARQCPTHPPTYNSSHFEKRRLLGSNAQRALAIFIFLTPPATKSSESKLKRPPKCQRLVVTFPEK
jgi:hypothetical protein